MVPFRGRIIFRQYNKSKAHAYGIKIFKLCVKDCYTIAYKIYAGKEATPGIEVSSKVVLELSAPYLNFGRTIYIDNWYTSVKLAETLLQNETHVVGTLRKNRKFNPKNVIDKKLRKGEVVAQKNDKNVVVLKWKDRREVLMLSTKHVDDLVTTVKNGKETTKPQMVVDYNQGKSFIDLSDQMSAYHSGCLTKSVKWYVKIAFDLLINTSCVNAWSIYKTVTNNNINSTDFKEAIVNSWLDQWLQHRGGIAEENPEPIAPQSTATHKLIATTRGRCKSCYNKMKTTFGRAVAVNKTKRVAHVALKCNMCNQTMCKDCFFKLHKSNI